MNDEQVGFNLADLRKLCKSYIDYTRTYMDRKEVRRINRQRSSLDNFVFQFSSEVVDFSSQYGSDISISYTASNVTGRPSKFPNYGDFPQSYVMRSYGPWRELAPSRKCPIMPQNSGRIRSEDFIILSFTIPVIPLVISIFETFTPGSVVRISGKVIDLPDTMAWRLLWEGLPQNCNGMRHSRLFAPKLKHIKELVREICIEFNHSQLQYYTELDAVSMGGILKYPENGELDVMSVPMVTHTSSGYVYDNNEEQNQELLSNVRVPSMASNIPMSTSLDPFLKLIRNIEELENEWRKVPAIDYTLRLPNESLMQIFSYLDLKSLRLCMRVCKRFNNICTDGYFYRELNLKPYWCSFSYSMLISLEPYCDRMTKMDLSWCGITKGILTTPFNLFLKRCGRNLTNIRLDCCEFVNDTTLIAINLFCPHLKELSLRSCTSINFGLICPPQSLTEMERIDLYRTNITIDYITFFITSMPKLKHINLGSCKRIESMDNVAYELSTWNKQLVSVDFWKSYTLSPTGLRYLTVLKQLEEIDLGWCLAMSIPGDSLLDLVKSCPKLKKIIVVSLRGVCDRDLLAFADFCPLLEQIDLVGLRAITVDACSKFLQKCKNLKLMDVNFCENIKEDVVNDWRLKYPNVCIQFTTSDHSNVYHY
ncbi:F-box/LRR-repeat protein 4 [Metopolophium dirhodum]|uniref:F-box/LRR-repeat protein 4 n=1 Tax=Metopolophium dirhodum TaxID=44670 RepID=UPI00298F4B4A|nr:F-box/LRR-repeat protein 4 [Metopolophium dirhodum]